MVVVVVVTLNRKQSKPNQSQYGNNTQNIQTSVDRLNNIKENIIHIQMFCIFKMVTKCYWLAV